LLQPVLPGQVIAPAGQDGPIFEKFPRLPRPEKRNIEIPGDFPEDIDADPIKRIRGRDNQVPARTNHPMKFAHKHQAIHLGKQMKEAKANQTVHTFIGKRKPGGIGVDQIEIQGKLIDFPSRHVKHIPTQITSDEPYIQLFKILRGTAGAGWDIINQVNSGAGDIIAKNICINFSIKAPGRTGKTPVIVPLSQPIISSIEIIFHGIDHIIIF
jgi:hypothetical protein